MKEGQGGRQSLRELANRKVVNLAEFRARREGLTKKQEQVGVKPKPELIGDKITDINAVRRRREEKREAKLEAYLLKPLTPEEWKEWRDEIRMQNIGRFGSIVLEPPKNIEKRSLIEIMAENRRGLPRGRALVFRHIDRPEQRRDKTKWEHQPGQSNNQSEGQAGVHNEGGEKTEKKNWYKRSGEQDWLDMPHELLVGIIKNKLDQKRAEYEKQGVKFDPVEWITKEYSRHIFSGNNLSWDDPRPTSCVNHHVLDFARVFEAITLPHIKSADYRDIVESILIEEATGRRGSTVTLEPKAVKFLDAMADACGIKRSRGEATFDLLGNVRLAGEDSGIPHPDPVELRRTLNESHIIFYKLRKWPKDEDEEKKLSVDIFCVLFGLMFDAVKDSLKEMEKTIERTNESETSFRGK